MGTQMTVTSFFFFLFLLLGGILYYLVPAKLQWKVLLLLSLFYYFLAAESYTILFPLLSTLLAYAAGRIFEAGGQTASPVRKKQMAAFCAAAVFLNVLLWFLLKGSSFWIGAGKALHHFVPAVPQLAPLPWAGALGMGYYTAQVTGYIMDCYWGTIRPQRNPFKLFLFVSFFPQLTVGPISRYSQLESLYERHTFSYDNLCLGSQRILWGLFKKLVISDRVGLIIQAIWAEPKLDGFWIWIAVLLFPLQLYTDFSGCMDIVLGAAELFDIHLPENFKNPFFSGSVQEFWQRWHITLGAWARDYVYYPLLKSRRFRNIRKWAKARWGNTMGKRIPWILSMGVLWFVMGFWHGSIQHIIGVGAWFFLLLVISELCSPLLKKITCWLRIPTESFSWKLFQCVRTYILYSLGTVFFSAPGIMEALNRFRRLFASVGHLNPWIFFDGSITQLGVTYEDVNLILLGILLLVAVAVLREKFGYARTWMQKQILPFRWLAWIFLLLLVMIYGMYGPGYNAAAFLYEGF